MLYILSCDLMCLYRGLSQDYESKLEALQKQVDRNSRYLESPDEEEEPEEEGETLIDSYPSRTTFIKCLQ